MTEEKMREIAHKHALQWVAPPGSHWFPTRDTDEVTMQNVVRGEEIIFCAIKDAFARPEALCIPEGWKLVPLEPTLTMKTAAEVYRSKCQYAGEQKTFGGYYRAMLAATPSVPSPLARSQEKP